MRLDNMDIRSLAALSSSPHFRRVVSILEKELEKTDKALRVTTEENFKRMQGRAILLEEILSNIASSRELAKDL